ncbi:MAG: hypothetical protein CVU84_00685 [Firmicutes bacterium HGW-Firmicutes-1]|jgi:protein-tyrosine phosphatase|nr:MAG: hypothetical protein CVU84_00685 [Firmicutes bacterium HGW-Firmicutes-1]
MMDIHSHIIYGLDDGAKTIEDSELMINMAYNDGIRSMIATPHYNKYYIYDIESMEKRFQEIVDKFKEDKSDLKFYLGNEAYLDEYLLEALVGGKCKTLGGSQYVLIELSYNSPLQMVKKMLFDIIISGYIPIIAHCERLIGTKDDLNKIIELKEMGCYMQINVSILNKSKIWLKRWLLKRLKDHTISFVSSDAHNISNRRPILMDAYNMVSKKIGREIADNVFLSNPEKIVLGGTII